VISPVFLYVHSDGACYYMLIEKSHSLGGKVVAGSRAHELKRNRLSQ